MWLTFDIQRGSFPQKSLKLVTYCVLQFATQWLIAPLSLNLVRNVVDTGLMARPSNIWK